MTHGSEILPWFLLLCSLKFVTFTKRKRPKAVWSRKLKSYPQASNRFHTLTHFSICSLRDHEYVFKVSPNEAQIYWVQEYQLNVAHLLADRKQQVKGLCHHSPIIANSRDPKHKDLHWQNFSWRFASNECWTQSIINGNCDSSSDNHSYLIDCSLPLSLPVLQEMSKTILFTAVAHVAAWNTYSNSWRAFKELNSQHSIFSIRLS